MRNWNKQMDNISSPQKPSRFSLSRFLFGKPIATRDLEHQRVNRIIGLAVFASDAL